MSTVIRYSGHPSGYMDFYMGEELILCENTVSEVTAQQLWDAITDVEDEPLALGFEGIADADGKTPFVDTVLNVILLRNWRIGSEKTSGSFTIKDGNVVSETTGRDIFEPNLSISMINQLSQFGVVTGSNLTAQDISDIKTQLKDIHQANYNKRVHDDVADTITIYEDDGVTPKQVFDTNADLSDITPQ